LTLIPRPRLIGALLLGALLLLLTIFNPLFWLLVVAYHGILLITLISDGARLPSKKRFELTRTLPDPFSLGEAESVVVEIQHPRAAGLLAEVADHAPLDLDPTPRILAGHFDSNGRLVAEYHTQARHRGSFHFGGVDLRCWRKDGWLVRQVRLPSPQTAAVYPSVLAIKRYDLIARRGMRLLLGQRRARTPGASTAFSGLRDYLPGDDVRRISWKATARRDNPVVLEVEAERGQQAIIALDCGRLMTAPAGPLTKLDHAVNAALLLAWVAHRHGDRVGMITFSDRVHRYSAPQRGPTQMSLLNRLLYDVRAEYTEPDFAEAFSQLALRVSRRSLVVVLTDVLDPLASAELVGNALRLSARHLVLVVAMADPEVLAARDAPVDDDRRPYEWAAAEELLAARRQSFQVLQQGGVLGLDVPAGRLSPMLVERYLELKERALL
jgi:uncharacterized protein (DUF58 family)